MHRRDFLRTAGGAAGGAGALAASGSATAQAAEQPDYGGYLSGANGFDGSTVDLRGQDAVTIAVGAGSSGYTFDPAAVWVDPGTTIVWEWTGEGGAHNVVGENTDFTSGDTIDQEGYTYERTFEESGIVTYYCNPHQDLGMLGAIAVGDDVPTVEVEAGGGAQSPEEMGVPFQPHFVGIATLLMLGMTFVYTFFFLKYGESAHTSGGRN
ncbi:halocyanin domain-containing protein [Halapricum hydrolyticum]|uniref:Halocyanin domain-containing protein n=1 Tax=Halapricum hydrolyticum TaxID=2979991 RepID=A0AAE3IF49_9EURY|nr:halocyanin domain-containing protein [Halapricum hydrolyticum]MCU4718347.1 halocyanin domain-containing protein [Halapricum hydrolyticum]MCU4727205.1 halocyanin domain-containing protein [Halapricum hydrolyticum]